MRFFTELHWGEAPMYGYMMGVRYSEILLQVIRVHQLWIPGVNDQHRKYVVP